MSKFSNFLGINVKTIIPYVDILLLQKYNCFVGNLFKKENPTASWVIYQNLLGLMPHSYKDI